MGKQNRRKGERPRRRVVPGMAEDRPPEADTDSLLHQRRTLHWSTHGLMFLLSYLSYAEDGGFSVPGHGAPRKEGESAEDYEQRRDLTRRMVEVQAALGSWAEQAADDLRHIMPSDAHLVARRLLGQGYDWAASAKDKTRIDPDPVAIRAGAGQLVAEMCPENHRADAEDLLTAMCLEMTLAQPGEPAKLDLIGMGAEETPIATIHAAAALTTWLYLQCVEDRAATHLKILAGVEKTLPYL